MVFCVVFWFKAFIKLKFQKIDLRLRHSPTFTCKAKTIHLDHGKLARVKKKKILLAVTWRLEHEILNTKSNVLPFRPLLLPVRTKMQNVPISFKNVGCWFFFRVHRERFRLLSPAWTKCYSWDLHVHSFFYIRIYFIRISRLKFVKF